MMGLFSKKKSKQPESSTFSNQRASQTVGSATAPHSNRSQQLLSKTLPYPSKSVRFASAVSDDEGGFVTDSELEINRNARYGSLRARPTSSAAPSSSSLTDRHTFHGSQSYDYGRDQGRSQSYSERQNTGRLSGPGGRSPLWRSNGVMSHTNSTEDDYMSDSSTASSFTRGSRARSSLPILKHINTRPVGLVFLTYQNETKKAVLPTEIKNLDTIKALFLRCFPQQLTPDLLNSPRRRFYILDRASNKFFLLVHLQEVRDGTMLKLVDSDALTPSTVRRSRSAHSALTSEPSYYSEPEFDIDSSSRVDNYTMPAPLHRMSITKETNIDEPITNGWHHQSMPSHNPPASTQPAYLDPISVTQNGNHMASSSQHLPQAPQPLAHSGITPGNYRPPQPLHMSTVRSTASTASHVSPSVSNISTGSSNPNGKNTVESRNRMAMMESQIASLTALVQTALTSSRPSSSASDRLSEVSYQSNSNRSSVSGGSSSTPQPGVSVELQEKMCRASDQVKDLRTEFKQLKRIHEAQSEAIQDTIRDAFTKIQNAVNSIPGANGSPLRLERRKVDAKLDSYKREHASVLSQIGELEACVSELRSDVVSRHCHVNLPEVEALALKLSKATRGAADIKAKFPRLVKELKAISQSEMDSVICQHEFVSREPEKIEEGLRRCKAITNVLFTLKRLAAVDSRRTVLVPQLQTCPVDESMRKQLFQQIRNKAPNHSDRVKSIEKAEKSFLRRKDLTLAKDILKFEKSLELASRNLKDAEQTPKTDPEAAACLNKLVEQAKDYRAGNIPPSNGSTKRYTNGRSSSHSGHVVNRRTKSQNTEQPLPFIQNRDSIHWDVDSDSDDEVVGDAAHQEDFVDVTETVSSSAFTVVRNTKTNASHSFTNGRTISAQQQISSVNLTQSIANGKGSVSPDPKLTENRHKDLQQQCQRLQDMQRHHRLTPTMPSTRAPANTPTSTPNSLNKSFPTPATPRVPHSNGMNGKPAIAPKPQLRSSMLKVIGVDLPGANVGNISSSSASSSSTGSYDGSPSLKDHKSTTV